MAHSKFINFDMSNTGGGGRGRFTLGPMTLDESKTHIFLSPFFKYISSLKVQFNVK